ncbi:hypothetical protein H4R19_002788 [Coemansia spiralis]|nr:hypothetical protein H4R19_002788 [Coemansia spiralis]
MMPLGLRACMRSQLLVNPAAAALAPGAWRAAARSVARPAASAALVAARLYVRGPSHRYMIDDYGLFTDYIASPMSASPSIFSKKGLLALRERIVNRVTMVVSLGVVKFLLWGWKRDVFAAQAEELYGAMNVAFARGDIRALGDICTQKMVRTMTNDIKSRNTDLSWEKVRSLSPPRVVQMRCGRVTSSVYVGQVTVRVDQEQRVTTRPRGGARSKASPGTPKTVRVREYIVFQREVSDDTAPWTIYGKIAVPSWDQPTN